MEIEGLLDINTLVSSYNHDVVNPNPNLLLTTQVTTNFP